MYQTNLLQLVDFTIVSKKRVPSPCTKHASDLTSPIPRRKGPDLAAVPSLRSRPSDDRPRLPWQLVDVPVFTLDG